MKKFYEKFCWCEKILASSLLAGIMVLVFAAAMFRTFKHPLNWAQDAALVAFAWLVFLGSDLAVRTTGLIGIDLLQKKFPPSIQKALNILFQLIIIGFLMVLVVYGVVMVQTGYQRQINTLHISYAWVTAAVPVGALCMIVSTAVNLVNTIKSKNTSGKESK
ncbi:MAG: TRAP transporter small permease [Lachnospiraceae bacterium]|nr:TRAP transporter small permease [Lachnospiraceae bacterium]